MSRLPKHTEHHAVEKLGWLRAAVLGANDGTLSTGSLIVGVASSHAARGSILVAGLSALVAGALSMAAGEYVSVSSQADSEHADLAREKRELATDWGGEIDELAGIYRKRGLDETLARQVATELMKHDALGAHARDELGLSAATTARPFQAALASASAFFSGALLPVMAAVLTPEPYVSWGVSLVSVLALAGLGAVGAVAGGAPPLRPTLRVTFWGIVAMIVTGGIGQIFGV
ncbi:VIT1/CCC1 transporter family protein [Gluconacetobacter takamatsuzukensis]|uniref:VIT family protein n=1 Tax=Gluconacetobacter takamatsuzukensis TaxID=1286190 RepID=A0A7W4KCW5_9PROT|nr:VIT family protein [Gluconacetobacter takamatsuzukensis]MBB2204561.1 VIT family protein [Gluconacetobacter takamatsuzukensis]